MRPRRSWQDWFVALFAAGATVAGLAIAIGKRDRAGFAIAAFFAGCTAVGVRSLVRARRIRAHAGALAVRVQEHVPLRASRSRLFVWAGAGAGIGAVMAATGAGVGVLFAWMGGAMAMLGVLLIVLALLRKLPSPFVQFEPAGLRVGAARHAYLIEWDNVATVAPGEMHGNDLLLINVRSVERLCATALPATAGAARLAKTIGSNRAWFGADIALAPVQYGSDVALLAHAMRGYLEGDVFDAAIRAI